MRIINLNVESYGPFEALQPADFSRQLTVITGPNEAGKSALRAFMSMVLFGRKRANAPDARWFNYAHDGGGVGRGSLTIEAGGRNYTVYRREGSALTISDGENTSNEELLNTLIGRIDGALYQRVFSINLTELEQLNLLTDEQVKGRIYSAGLGLGAVTLPDIKKAIEDERSTAGGLWSDRKGRLRAELEELATKTSDLELARSELQAYESLNSEIAGLSSDITTTEGLRRDLSTERERLRRVEDLRASWDALDQLRHQLEDLPDTDAFPPDGITQIERLERDGDSIAGTIRRGDLEQAQRDDRAGKLAITEAFSLHDPAIRAAVDEAVVYERLVRDLPGREEVRVEVELELKAKLRELGPDWDERRVSAFRDTAGARSEIRRSGGALDAANRKRDTALNAASTAELQVKEQRDKLQSTTSSLNELDGVPDNTGTEIESRRRLLEQLRRANSDRETYARDVRDIETRAALPIPGRPASFPRILPVLTALVGIALVAWGVFATEISGVVGGGLVLAATIGLWLLAGRGGDEETLGPAQSLDGHLRELRALHETSAAETGRLAKLLGFESVPAGRDIQLALDDLGLDLEARRAFERRQEDAHATGEALQISEAGLQRLLNESSAMTISADEAETDWRATLHHWTLDQDLDLTAANDVIGGIERLNEVLARVETERQRVDGITAEIDRIDHVLKTVMEATNSPVPPPRQGLAALNELKRRHEAERQARVELRTFKELASDWTGARKVQQEQLDALEITRSALLTGTGVESEDDFRRLGEARTTRARVEGQVRDRETDHPLLVSDEGDWYRKELARLSSEEVRVRVIELEGEIDILDSRVLELHGNRGAREVKRRELEEANPVADLQSEIAVLTEKVRADADRWAVLTIARQLIEKASQRFQDQRQAPLLRSASGYFREMTIGEYTSVQEVLGEDRLLVLHRNGATKDVIELSRGTVEQLFLALRFALIEEYCRNTEPMPVLLDDVLVNFDPERARAAAAAIVKLSRQHQVIALTCHPGTVAMFQEAAIAAGVEPPNIVSLKPGTSAEAANPDPAISEPSAGPVPGSAPSGSIDAAEPGRPRMHPLL